MNDTIPHVARLLRRLASSAFTPDAAGRPVCSVCTFQSEAWLVKRDDARRRDGGDVRQTPPAL